MRLINLDATPFQEFFIPFEGENITVRLRFLNSIWIMDVECLTKAVRGLKLSSRVLMLEGNNFPFDFTIDDKGIAFDPYRLESLNDGRFDFYLLERADMIQIRGFDVP